MSDPKVLSYRDGKLVGTGMTGIEALEDEIERLKTERAGDQQRLFHYEGVIDQLRREREQLLGIIRGINMLTAGVLDKSRQSMMDGSKG